jgi:hypothetical protein
MDMEKLVSLCKRRGFIFQSSEIYGGLNGFWDYGPLGVELKRNIKETWWRDMVTGHDDLATPPGAPEAYEMTTQPPTVRSSTPVPARPGADRFRQERTPSRSR